jgi:tetratricopeptide (TPR) repeat protein
MMRRSTRLGAMRALALLIAVMIAVGPAWAQPAPGQTAVTNIELDFLFARLSGATSPAEAAAIEMEIRRIWMMSGSPTIDLLLSRAIAATEAQENALALDLLDGIIVLRPDFAEAWYRRAVANYNSENYGAAIADVQRVLALEPRHFAALSGLGQTFHTLGDDQRALAALSRALEINPFMNATRRLADELRAALAVEL